MSLALDLPPELESGLAAEAAQLRLPRSEYAMRLEVVGPGDRVCSASASGRHVFAIATVP
jgi:hypothetical protein